MKSFAPALLQYLATRGPIVSHRLLWIEARRRDTGATETIGVWSGEYDLAVTIEGAARTYLGVGRLLGMDALAAGVGLDVRSLVVRLAAVDPSVETIIKGYETRFAPVEIHQAIFRGDTRVMLAEPARRFRGFLNTISFPRDVPGEEASAELELVSETRVLTRTLAVRKSDEAQQMRGGDRFRRYGDVSGSVLVPWGELRTEVGA